MIATSLFDSFRKREDIKDLNNYYDIYFTRLKLGRTILLDADCLTLVVKLVN